MSDLNQEKIRSILVDTMGGPLENLTLPIAASQAKMDQLASYDAIWYTLHGFGQVAKELLFLAGIRQAEEGTQMGIIIIPQNYYIGVRYTSPTLFIVTNYCSARSD